MADHQQAKFDNGSCKAHLIFETHNRVLTPKELLVITKICLNHFKDQVLLIIFLKLNQFLLFIFIHRNMNNLQITFQNFVLSQTVKIKISIFLITCLSVFYLIKK
jgi:hypothetical protein